MRVGIICAMDEEIKQLRDTMEQASTKTQAGVSVTTGSLFSHDIILCLAGIGKTNAAATTQLLISTYRPDLILNIGLAGNCSDSLPLGGAVVAEQLLYHDFNMQFAAEGPPFLERYQPEAEIVDALAQACQAAEIQYVRGTVATGDIFVGDKALRDDIVARTNCACVEMEGAAIAHIASKNNVRYGIVKLMSDNADDSALDTFHESLPLGAYCDRSVAILTVFLRGMQ